MDKKTVLYSKNIYLENKIFDGFIEIEDGKIQKLMKEYEGSYEDFSSYSIIPGFIDNHIHGFGTGSFWLERTEKSVLEMQKHLPKTGVTSFLPTSGADSIPAIETGIEIVRDIMKGPQEGAEVTGIHLEGPFINKEFKGMQNETYCIDPDITLMKRFYDLAASDGVIRLMTLAPELDGAKEVITFCKDHSIQISIGHSAASFEEITELKDYGIGGVTHMYSGMKGLHHRALGVAGTALYYDDLYCEFAKQTGLTVSHEAFDIVFRLKGSRRIILTTDNSGIARSKEPKYHYIRKATFLSEGNEFVIKHDDGREERFPNDDYEAVKDVEMNYINSVKNMRKHTEMTVHDIIKMTAENPAKYTGLFHRKGSIDCGKDADLLVVNNDFDLLQVYCRGDKQL